MILSASCLILGFTLWGLLGSVFSGTELLPAEELTAQASWLKEWIPS